MSYRDITTRAMVLRQARAPLQPEILPIREPGPEEMLLKVRACGVCRTDLHIVDGELAEAALPLVPGHEIVGEVIACGADVGEFRPGDRVGVPWLASICGSCHWCRDGRENLCDAARFTGYHVNGGYAEWMTAHHRFCLRLPDAFGDCDAAPLLCAGLIGHRALRMAGDPGRIGLFGFGAAAHIVAQLAAYEGRSVYAFTRPGDTDAQQFAREFGAVWAGDSTAAAPDPLDAAIIFAPVGALIPAALRQLIKGGTVVCGGIHMSDVPGFPYQLLWGERRIVSVANLTRRDGVEFMRLAPKVPVRTHIEVHALRAANRALDRLRSGQLRGAAVLDCANPGW